MILALDQGTTSSRAILYSLDAEPVDSAQQEFKQIFPKPGWVEHDPIEIWDSQRSVVKQLLDQQSLEASAVQAIGITNQRETTIIWDRNTGEPVYNAIVWQDRRTSEYCKQLVQEGHADTIRSKTGLVIDAYFSGTKVKWILDNVEGARARAESGDLLFGTVDSWLIWKLTGGSAHITDATNASRTLLYNIHTSGWDNELLELLNIPSSLLPTVTDSSGPLAETAHDVIGASIPICGIAGDQQAALFGQMCIEPGMAKCTYGTGCFLVTNTGAEAVTSSHNLLTTVAWRIDGNTTYAIEGSVFVGGAVIQWLRDGLELFDNAAESESLASSVDDTGDVFFVPALTGLGAPHWDQDARGTIVGITRGTTKAHLTRAALQSIAFQVNDVLRAMGDDTGVPIRELRVDGGAVANNLLVQMQADISQTKVIRPTDLETTALGAAYLAGIGAGIWSQSDLVDKWKEDRMFQPEVDDAQARGVVERWKEAVKRSLKWI